MSDERKQSINKLKKHDKYVKLCDVSDKQHAEILELVSKVHDSGAVQQLISEGDQILGEDHNAYALWQAWKQDVT